MDWSNLASIAAIAMALGTLVTVVWRGGRMAQRMDQHQLELGRQEAALVRQEANVKEQVAALNEKIDDHADKLSEGGKSFAGIKATLDTVVSQQQRIESKLDRLTQQRN